MTRVILWFLGGVAAFVAAFWAVTSTADLALSAGLYGTSGTYRVKYCTDVGLHRRHSHSHYDCQGYFTPADGGADDAVDVELKDTGHDYPDGTEFPARQGREEETIQRAGIRGVVGELWQVGMALTGLCWLAYLAISPPKSSKPKRSREPSRRERVAERVGVGIAVCVAVSILGFAANLIESFTS